MVNIDALFAHGILALVLVAGALLKLFRWSSVDTDNSALLVSAG